MKIIKEIWKPIEGFENLYEVSDLGRIKSLNYHRTGVEKFLKPRKNERGYLYVNLYRDGKRKTFKIHRLVGTAFLPNPMCFTEINHKDEDKTNNTKSNIEWCDSEYNTNYGSRNKRIASAQINHPAKSKVVEASKYSDFREICLRFASTKEADRNGYFSSNVSKCCRGCFNREGNNKYRGLYWRYAS